MWLSTGKIILICVIKLRLRAIERRVEAEEPLAHYTYPNAFLLTARFLLFRNHGKHNASHIVHMSFTHRTVKIYVVESTGSNQNYSCLRKLYRNKAVCYLILCINDRNRYRMFNKFS